MNENELSRVKEFRQLKKQIQGSETHVIVGIDVAKERHHAFLGTASGRTLVKKLIFENSASGFSELLDRVEAVRAQNGLSDIVFGLEPTSNYHKPLGRYLISKGYHVVLVAGKAVKNNRELLDERWDKHDTKDAANIADLVSRGKCFYYDMPSREIEELRELLALRARLKKEEHSLGLRIRNNLLAKHFPELDSFYSACERETLAIVRWCLNPQKIAAMPFDEFFKRVAPSTRGIAQKLRLQKIHHLAHESIGCPVGGAVQFQAGLLVEKIKQVREQIMQVEQGIQQLCVQFPSYDYLLSIPGFGPYVASKVLATIADPRRFDSAKQVIRTSGYDLCADRSGKRSDQAVPVISKKGNSQLRYALYQAALIASSRHRFFMAYFARMLQGREREQGIRTKMRVKLAAKMLVIAWTLMKKGEPFNPEYLNAQ
jgi:transposase